MTTLLGKAKWLWIGGGGGQPRDAFLLGAKSTEINFEIKEIILSSVLHRKSPEAPKKRVKQATKWNLGGTSRDMKDLDFSGSHGDSAAVNGNSEEPTELEVVSSSCSEILRASCIVI